MDLRGDSNPLARALHLFRLPSARQDTSEQTPPKFRSNPRKVALASYGQLQLFHPTIAPGTLSFALPFVASAVVLSASWFTVDHLLRSSSADLEQTVGQHTVSSAHTLVEHI